MKLSIAPWEQLEREYAPLLFVIRDTFIHSSNHVWVMIRWRALITYLENGTISFAPLQSLSSGSLSSSEENKGLTRDYHDGSCSPKSMYRLADKVSPRVMQLYWQIRAY